jgi:hypothetical protein
VAVQTYDDKVTLQSVCRQFRHMSQRLLEKIPTASSTADTQFAFNSRLSHRRDAALMSR